MGPQNRILYSRRESRNSLRRAIVCSPCERVARSAEKFEEYRLPGIPVRGYDGNIGGGTTRRDHRRRTTARARSLDELELRSDHDGLQARVDAELIEHLVDMVARGHTGDAQLARDVVGRVSRAEQPQYL